MAASPVFVVGCPRSGTRLLRDMLRSHPSLSFARESQFIPVFWGAYGNPRSDAAARALARRILGLSTVRILGLGLKPDDLAQHRTLAGIVDAIFSRMADLEGKPRWGDKTPYYALQMPAVATVFPAARFIHIIRDGRDVAASWARASFGADNVYCPAREWNRIVRRARADGRTLGPEYYLEVRYEELVAAPEATMPGVCEFIDEPYLDAVLRPTPSLAPVLERRVGAATPHNVSETEVVAQNRGKWRTQLSARERAAVESAAGALLEDLGYPALGPAAPPPLPRRAGWRVHGTVTRLVNLLNRPSWSRDSITIWAAIGRFLVRSALARAQRGPRTAAGA